MICKKSFFLDNDYSSAGVFYLDPECSHPLFVGQLFVEENLLKINILENYDSNSFSSTLYAQLKGSCNQCSISSWTFFDCSRSYNNKSIEFVSFIEYDNHNNEISNRFYDENGSIKTSIPNFLSKHEKYEQISVKFENFSEWLWKVPLIKGHDNLFPVKYVTKSKEVLTGYRKISKSGCLEFNKNINEIIIPAEYLKKRINITSNLSIEFNSSPIIYQECSNYQIEQSCHINIVLKQASTIESFYHVIYWLSLYFSVIGYGVCKIENIYYFKPIKFLKNKTIPPKRVIFFDNRLPWNIKCNETLGWFFRDKLYYHTMKKDFATSLKTFWLKRRELSGIVTFLANIDNRYNRKDIETYIVQQIQCLETYGNIKLKGKYSKKNNDSHTKQDLMKVISILPNDIFDKVFIHNNPNNDYRGWEVFGPIDKDKDISELKDCLPSLLMELRNFIVHPCKDGYYKKIENTKVLPYYITSDKMLNLNAVSALSVSLNFLLRWLVFKEIGLDKYFSI